MKKFTAILLALCVLTVLVSVVACDDKYDDYEETLGGSLNLETQDGPVTAPPSESDREDNAYIAAAPANDEQGWGALNPRP